MKMRKYITLLAALCIFTTGFSQTCNCESNFEWVKKTFEENDAGFEYVLERKGQQAYEDHNRRILSKVRNTQNLQDCSSLLYDWLEFFRSGHISIRLTDIPQQETALPVQQDFSNWEQFRINLPEFEKYLKKKKDHDLEGIWETGPYKIAIKKKGNQYIGTIVTSGAETWTKNQVKLKTDENMEHVVFYMRDHSAIDSEKIKFLGNNYVQIGNIQLKRSFPVLPADENVERYLTMLTTTKPYLEQLNRNTLMFRIPSFNQQSKAAIDSVIQNNRDLILKTENLIIDIRNGTGGSDSSFRELLPILYTNPIRTVGVAYRSTKLNNQRMLDFINKPEYGLDEEDKKWARAAYENLEKNLGKYMRINQYDVTLTQLDTVYPYPKNVGIVINRGNGSTDEQFLLAAKQSKKVKLFGTTTHGVLDISNMYYIDSPCKEFQLGYALSKSKRIPDFAIDEIGIQPDFFMDADIPEYDWIDYTDKILNGKP